jgi:hypothetical protein
LKLEKKLKKKQNFNCSFFEDDLRKALAECRDFYKNFLFTSGLRGLAVKNPGLCVLETDEDGNRLWLEDPVHPHT